MKYISIIDNGINNLKSIVGAVNHFGFKTKITNDKDVIMNSSGLILPGVGSFPAGMKKLRNSGLDETIKNFFKKDKPILAICLGFQMLFSSSNEFKNTKGLNILHGKVKSLKDLKTKKIVPNLGWNILDFKKKGITIYLKKSVLNHQFTLFTLIMLTLKTKAILPQQLILVEKRLLHRFSLKICMVYNSTLKKVVLMA